MPLNLAAAFLGGCGGEDLSFRWQPGETRTYLRTEQGEGTAPDGRRRTFRMDFTTTEEAVEVIPGRTVTTRVTFDRVAGEILRGDDRAPIRFDSAAPEGAASPGVDESDKEAAAFLRSRGPVMALVGRAVEATWQESGLFVKFDGLEGLRAAMAEGRAADDPFRRAVDQIVNSQSLHSLLRPHLVVGERSMAPGAEKTFQDMGFAPESVGGAGFVYTRGTFTLKEVVDGVARVEIQAEASLDPYPGMPPWPPAAAALRNRLRLERGTCRGFARIETATGRLLEDEHVTELDLRFLPADGSAEVPIPAKQTRRLKLLK